MRSVSRSRPLVAVSMAVALLSAACSAGTDDVATVDSTTATAPLPTEAAPTTSLGEPADSNGPFAATSLDVTAVEPLDRVGIVGGVDTSSAWVAAYPVGDGVWGSTAVLTDDQGRYFLAPPAFTDPVGGGEIEILLTDGEAISGPLGLEILALGEEPGGFERELAALIDSVDEDAALYGSSWDELMSTAVAAVPRELTGLKVAQMLIDDGAGGGAAGSYASLDTDDAAVIDALIAKIGLTDPIDLDLPPEAFPPDAPEPVGFAGRFGPVVPAAPSPAGAPMGLRSAPAPSLGGADCIPFPAEDIGAARLSEMMLKSKLGSIATDSSQGPGRYLAASELAFGVSAALEAAGSGGKSKIAATILQAVAARKMQHALNAGLMPSFFSNIDVEIDETEHEEDREEPGRWTKVWVTAQSTGYSLDADLIGAAIDGVGGELIGTAGLPQGSLVDIEGGAAVGEVKNAVNDVVGKTSTISFCPNTWRVDVAGEEWSWARPEQALFTVDNAAQTFKNDREVGRDTLKFGPLPYRFGGATINGDVPISTEAIEVSTSPDVLWVTNAGETVGVITDIDHAVDTELSWVTEKGRWTDSPDAATPGAATRPLQTPTNPQDYPFRVEVDATSKGGLRALPGAPRRYDFLEVKLAPIIVTPNPGSVQTSKTLGFTATDREGELIDVTWSATGGTTARADFGTTIYTAGGVEGEFEVTARLVSNPSVYATVVVFIANPCLIGTWRVDAQFFADEMMRLSDEPITVAPAGGTWDLTVAPDLSFVSVQSDWALQFTTEGVSGTSTTNDTQTGTMQATADEILSVTTTSRDFSGRLDFPGRSIDLTPDSVPLDTEFNPGTYECEAGRMYVTSEGATFAFDQL